MRNILNLFQSVLTAFGTVWLVLGAYYGLANTALDGRIGFGPFLVASFILGVAWFTVDGYFFAGFLRRSIEITSNAIDTTITIMFGDLFAQDGFKAISVNEFFDSSVDEKHVASSTLHGIMLKQYWAGNTSDWDRQVTQELAGISPVETVTTRTDPGKQTRYDIGTTAKVSCDGHDFLCVAIARTDTTTLQASASSDDLNTALRALLAKARIAGSGHTLNIPLMGSGLARSGIKTNIIVDLILLAIFEESKREKVTDNINIVLHKSMKKLIDLTTIQKDWR